MGDVTVVIVTYNSAKYIKRCLASLKDQKVILVDNNSNDSTIELANHYPCKIIKNKFNLGYAKAANIGASSSKTDYVLLMNPDVYVKKDTIQNMLSFMKIHTDCDILGPKLLSLNNTLIYSCKKFPTLKTIFGRRFNIFKDDVDLYLMKNYNHKEARKVDWVSGACMMFKKNIRMNEKFFLYLEDVDLCRNKTVYYDPESVAYHEVQRSSAKNPFLFITHVMSYLRYRSS